MQVIYLKAFSKDIDKLKNKQVSKNLLDIISEIKKANNIQTGHWNTFGNRLYYTCFYTINFST